MSSDHFFAFPDRAFWKSVVRYFFPPICIVCGRVLTEGQNCTPGLLQMGLCKTCLSKLPIRIGKERVHPCLSDPYDEDKIPDLQVWVLFHYEMPVTSLLRRLKFHDGEYCGTALGKLMGRELLHDLPYLPDAIVPIPLSSKRLEKRGYNQAAVIAREIAQILQIPLLENVLYRKRHTKQQSRFNDPLVRQKNIEGAFGVEPEWDIEGVRLLVVDDILTSGATIHEAAQTLIEAGADEVLGVVCASHRVAFRQNDEKDTKKITKCH
jgi:ComF family protein